MPPSDALLPPPLTHFNQMGEAHIVDVGNKPETLRSATARGRISMKPATLDMILQGHAKKGDVLGIARIAAIQGSKQAASLIPLCHQIALTRVAIDFTVDTTVSAIDCEATAECFGRTGVEIEALTAVSIGLLTIYDMCKSVDRGMTIENIGLVEKKGGKSGHWRR